MNNVDIDLFGGIVSNADSEDIRPDVGQDLINFSLDKSGMLSTSDPYKVRHTINDDLFDSFFYWTDFTQGDAQFILSVDKDTQKLQIYSFNYLLQKSNREDISGTTTNHSYNFYNFINNASNYRTMSNFHSTGRYVRISASNTASPIIVQYIKDRKFFGYQTALNEWFVCKKDNQAGTVIYDSDDSQFFVDKSYPRMDYAKGKLLNTNSLINRDFKPIINALSTEKIGETTDTNYGTDSSGIGYVITESLLAGLLAYEQNTKNRGVVQHEYNFALVYDGNQIGPLLEESAFTSVATLKNSTATDWYNRGNGVKMQIRLPVATMTADHSTPEEYAWNPRITGIAVYRAASSANYARLKSKSNLRRIGTYRLDRDETAMERVSVTGSTCRMLDYETFVPADIEHHWQGGEGNRNNISGNGVLNKYWYWFSNGTDSNGDRESRSYYIQTFDDVFGIYGIGAAVQSVMAGDYFGDWSINEYSGNPDIQMVYNSGNRAAGGPLWIIIPGTEDDGDGYYNNCIIQDQSNENLYDVVVESYAYKHKSAESAWGEDDGTEYFYHLCRLSGYSFWDKAYRNFKTSATTIPNFYIYRTNEPVHFRTKTIRYGSDNRDRKFALLDIFDVNPAMFEAHPYADDKINHGYEVQHTFQGRRFIGDVIVNLGDSDEEKHKNMFLYSEIGQYDIIPSANFVQIQDIEGGRITGFSDMGGDLIIFQEKGVYALNMNSSDPSSWILSSVSNSVGCVATDSIVKIKDQIFFAGEDSIYYITPTHQLVPISEPINDKYRNLPIATKRKTAGVFVADEQTLYFLFGATSDPGGSTLCYCLNLSKGDITWTSRYINHVLSMMSQDFNGDPVFISNTERIDNPAAR